MSENPERAHVIIMKVSADTKKALVNEIYCLANLLDRDELTEGCICGCSQSAIYSYKVRPEQTHDEYFKQLEKYLKESA